MLIITQYSIKIKQLAVPPIDKCSVGRYVDQKFPADILLLGIKIIANELTKTPAPARNRGASRLSGNRWAPINGETMAKRRPQELAIPAAVPRIDDGKASGVHPYRTALNILWKKYSTEFSPTFDASVLTVAKRNNDIPMRAEDPTIAHLRPTTGTPYMHAPSKTPGIPHM